MQTYLICEHLEKPGTYFYWLLPAGMKIELVKNEFITNYAIVENRDDVTLVRVMGVATTGANFLYGHKKVLQLISSTNWNDTDANYIF